MAKIYLCKKNEDGKCENFMGKDGKLHDKLWTVERKITGNVQLSGAMFNGNATYIDFTLPTDVIKLPRGAKSVADDVAERLWLSETHYFGE